MIKSFGSKTAEHIFDGINSKESRKLHSDLHPKAARLLDQLNAMTEIETLYVPPSNNLEKLSGNYKGYWSIRINLKWRVIFKWERSHVWDVDIVDYHH